MYFDLNIDESFSQFADLESADTAGFCMLFSQKEGLGSINTPNTRKPIYSRINIEYQNRLDQSKMNNLRRYDIVCITNIDNNNISSIIKLEPDLVTVKLEDIRHLKKTFINTLKQKDICIEICIKNALYNSKDRIQWLNGVRRLLKLGCKRNLVISSGATISTELKSADDICKILGVFDLSGDTIKKILQNSEGVLRRAALRRFTSKGVIAVNENECKSKNDGESSLKKDFIIDYHKKKL